MYSLRISCVAICLGLLTIAGCGETADVSEDTASTDVDSSAVLAAVNEHCPIMGSEVTDDGGRTDWNGQTIGFCCPGCIDEWNALSDEDKTAKLAAAEEGSHDEHDHDSETQEETTEAG